MSPIVAGTEAIIRTSETRSPPGQLCVDGNLGNALPLVHGYPSRCVLMEARFVKSESTLHYSLAIARKGMFHKYSTPYSSFFSAPRHSSDWTERWQICIRELPERTYCRDLEGENIPIPLRLVRLISGLPGVQTIAC